MYKEYSQELIQELIHKVDIVDYISQYIELKKHGKDYFGVCPFHAEDTPSFSVNKEKEMFYCFGCGATGSIIQFIMMYQKMKFPQVIEYLIKYTKFDISQIKQEPELVKFLKQFNRKSKLKEVQHDILPLDTMNQFQQIPIYEWLQEGIEQDVMDKYQVRFDDKGKRAVFPIFDIDGNIINIKGRSLYDNYKELGLNKYIYYYPLGSNDFLYGLNFKKDIINSKNEVICVEGEKTVWHVEGWGINNVVALCTSHINEYQLRLLLELKCDITIAFDKGVLINDIKEQCKILNKFTNVYVMYDTEGLLQDKDSPCDRGLDIWNRLYTNKIKLGE
jgi:DNA primase